MRNPRVAALAHGQKVRALSIAAAEPTKEQGQGTESPPVADVFLINYGNNKGIRVRLNVETGEALEVQEMKGRPQSSLEEQAEAEALIRRDARMAALFRDGASVVGGFVVDPPEGTPTQGRYLEFHVVNADRKRILHKVFVDLATERSYIDAQRRRDPKLTIGGKHHAH